MIFDADAPLSRALPRQHYGLDFYGILKGGCFVSIPVPVLHFPYRKFVGKLGSAARVDERENKLEIEM